MSSNSRSFWKDIGKIGIGSERLKRIPFEVNQSDGSVSTNPEVVLHKWETDFKTLLNPGASESNLLGDDSNNDQLHDNVDNSIFNEMIHVDEVVKCIVNAKLGKAPGYDEIPNELLKNDSALLMLHSLYNRCFAYGQVPSAWSKCIITPIPKSSTIDPRDPLSYRGITLAPTMYKVYCSILNDRITKWCSIENVINDEQNGFVKNRSTIDQVYSLTNIIETRKLKKLSTFTAFIDFRKAYDMINRSHLFRKLQQEGLRGRLLVAVKSLYNDVKCCVRLNGFDTSWFDVKCGLKQGCPLSPTLFNLYINDLVSYLKDLNIGIDIGDTKVCILLYADDIVLLAESANDLQCLLNALSVWCVNNKMSVNCDKSNVIHFRTKSTEKTTHVFQFNDNVLEIVHSYRYLGVVLNEYLDYSEIAKTVAMSASRACNLLCNKKTTKTCK